MPKSFPTAAELDAITEDGSHAAGDGLYLQLRDGGRLRTWVLRYKLRGVTRWMGLGRRAEFTLTQARRRAGEHRQLLADKVDPLAARHRARAQEAMVTLQVAAERFVAAHRSGWTSQKHGDTFVAQLKLHTGRHWARPVDGITTNDIVAILEPLWANKPTTAGKLRSRLERVLDWATHAGFREGPNPAAWRGALEHRLPPLARVQTVVHRKAIPVAEAPKVYRRLALVDSTASKVVRLIAFTAVRPTEAREARAVEFDLDAKQPVWTVPPERAKSRRPHRIPLSPEAVALVRPLLASVGRSGLVFEGAVPGRPISDVTVRAALHDLAGDGVDLHGWRSTARTWMADNGWQSEVAEAALAHATGSKLEMVYQRSDFFEQRIPMMKVWAEFLASARPAA